MSLTEKVIIALLLHGQFCVTFTYLLGVGPAGFLVQKRVISHATFYSIYGFLYSPGSSQTFKDIFNWYTDFWLRI